MRLCVSSLFRHRNVELHGAGAAYDLTKDTARTSQSRAELDRKFRKTGSAVVSRGDLSKGLGQVQLCLLCIAVLCIVSDEVQEGGLCYHRAAFTRMQKKGQGCRRAIEKPSASELQRGDWRL